VKRANTLIFVLLPVLMTTFRLAAAQSEPLPLGSVSAIRSLDLCPGGYSAGAVCFQATVSCPETADIEATYGVINPRGISRGTIVLLRGSGGTLAGLSNYASTYQRSGFRVLQTAWATSWEDTGLPTKSVKAAACRAATLLSFFHQNFYEGNGGMCAQGFSAGSAEIAYSLTAYGSANYLDKVELLSGPVFSDITQGCMVPQAPPVSVCTAGQFGCAGSSWLDRPQYVPGTQATVGALTGRKCQSTTMTSPQDDDSWREMSIVDGTSASTFSYPKTAMAGWLCSNALNNSAGQGEIYYRRFTSPKQTARYSLTRIDDCAGPEGVDEGTTPAGENGFLAITDDMMDPVAGCIKRH
jgi:hypothetical protein